jgi:taurine--2-oxoglutarate transaminase
MPTDHPSPTEHPVLSHWYEPGSDGFTFVTGEEATVTDADGTTYLDFVSQLFNANAGYSQESIARAVADQLRTMPYTAPKHGNDTRTELADRLVELSPSSLTDVLYSVTGSEAVELAVHLARTTQDAPTVLSRYRAYHGSTYGAGSLTTDPLTRNTLERYAATTGHAHFLPPLSGQSPFDADSPAELADLAADHAEWVIRNQGPDSVAAVITEVVAGTSGAYTAPPGYFERLREICDTYDCLLIFDEVITGFGRCGEWFAAQTEGVEPDMLVFAKGVTGAYAPLAGVLLRTDVAERARAAGLPIGQTWGGHPASCAAGLAAIEAYEDGLLDRVRELSPVLEERLDEVAASHDVVGAVRGRGFLRALEFTDPETGAPIFDHRVEEGPDPMFELLRVAAVEHGVLFGPGRPTFNLMVAPPFCVDESDIDRAMAALDASIETVFG